MEKIDFADLIFSLWDQHSLGFHPYAFPFFSHSPSPLTAAASSHAAAATSYPRRISNLLYTQQKRQPSPLTVNLIFFPTRGICSRSRMYILAISAAPSSILHGSEILFLAFSFLRRA